MSQLAITATAILSGATLVAQVIIIIATVAMLSLVFRKPDTYLHHLVRKTADHAFLFGFLVSFGSLVGSLIYSNIIGFDPCELCWWQRVFIYPQVVIFAIALYNEKVNKVQDDMVFLYSLVLSLIGASIAVFQYYGQMFDPSLLSACASTGVSCSKIFFVSYGYITIPMMSLTAYLFLILFYFFNRHKRVSHRS